MSDDGIEGGDGEGSEESLLARWRRVLLPRGFRSRVAEAATISSLGALALTSAFVGARFGSVAAVSAGMAVIGQVLGDFLTTRLREVVDRRLDRGDGDPSLTEEQWRRVLDESLAELVGEDSPVAAAARSALADVVRESAAVRVALEEAAAVGEDRFREVATHLLLLGADVTEFRWVLGDLQASLQEIEDDVARQGAVARSTHDLSQQILSVALQVRDLVVATSVALGGSVVPGGDREGDVGAAPLEGVVEPYPGLVGFSTDRARWFHGRGAVLERLLVALSDGRAVVVVGVSGAGKSSLVQAGLLPAVAGGRVSIAGSRDWSWVLMTPGARPVDELAGRFAALTGVDAVALARSLAEEPQRFAAVAAQAVQVTGRRQLLVVDQFEELFTHGAGRWEREVFATALAHAGPAVVVPVVRADFYDRCAALSPLVSILEGDQVLVGPMSRVELREAVLRPAELAGLEVEPGLTEAMLADLGLPDGSGNRDKGDGGQPEAGRLPLLAHALRETWHRRVDGRLTIAGYLETGGIDGAVAASAERLHNRLPVAEQDILRAVMLRLVAVTADGAVVRHRARREDLGVIDEAMLTQLVAGRLVVADRDTLQLSHEALLQAWPRLAAWVATERDSLQLRQRLTEAAAVWQASGEDSDTLYRGRPLAAALDWATTRTDLTATERRFLTASENADQQALTQAHRRTRRFRALASALAIVLVISLSAGISATSLWRTSEAARAEAESAALGVQSTVAAGNDPSFAMDLAVQAWDASETVEARSALLSAGALPYAGHLGDQDGAVSVSVSRDGSRAVTGHPDSAVRVFDTATGEQIGPATLEGFEDNNRVAISPDGELVAATSLSDELRVWDITTGELLATLVGGRALSWHPDGSLATITQARDGQVPSLGTWRRGDDDLEVLFPLLEGDEPWSLAVDSSGESVAVGLESGAVEIASWDSPADRRRFSAADSAIIGLAFPFPGHIVVGAYEGEVSLRSTRDGAVADVLEDPDGIAFSEIVSSPREGVVYIAGIASWSELGAIPMWQFYDGVDGQSEAMSMPTGSTLAPRSMAVSADGSTKVVATNDGPILLFRWALPELAGPPLQAASATDLTFDASGDVLAAAYADGLVMAWSTRDASVLWEWRTPSGSSIGGIDISTQGYVAVAGHHDVHVISPEGTVVETLRVGPGQVWSDVSFSPDGSLLAAVGGIDTSAIESSGEDVEAQNAAYEDTATDLRVWRTRSWRAAATVEFDAGGAPPLVTFTSDGQHLVVRATESVQAWTTTDLLSDRTEATRTLTREYSRGLEATTDPATVALADGDTVTFYDLENGQTQRIGNHPLTVRPVATSPDSRLLAAGVTGQAPVQLWDTTSGDALATLIFNTPSEVNELAFSPDGLTLAAALRNGAIYTWPLDPDATHTRLRDVVTSERQPTGG